jgi:hypothetical protein
LKINTVSEANRSAEHWQEKRKRHIDQQWITRSFFRNITESIPVPCAVVLSRLMPRLLDDDNLVSAFKWIRDEIARCILPQASISISDRSPLIEWKYRQEKSSYKGIRIEIFKK